MSSDRYLNIAPIFAWQVETPPGVTVAFDSDVEGDDSTVPSGTRWGYTATVAVDGAPLGLGPLAVQTGTPANSLASAIVAASEGLFSTASGLVEWTAAGGTRVVILAEAATDRENARIEFSTLAGARAYGWATVGPHFARRVEIGGDWFFIWESDWLHDGVWIPRPQDYGAVPSVDTAVAVRRSVFGAGVSVVPWTTRDRWSFTIRGVARGLLNPINRSDTAFADAVPISPEAPFNLLTRMVAAATRNQDIRVWPFDRTGAQVPVQVCRWDDRAQLESGERRETEYAGRANLATVNIRLRRLGVL